MTLVRPGGTPVGRKFLKIVVHRDLPFLKTEH
jgi:hypothetical protein